MRIMNSENTAYMFSEHSDREAMLQMIDGFRITQAIYVAAKLGIADLLKDGQKHCDELGAKTNIKSDSMYRLLRALSSLGIFSETDDRCFQLTSRGVYLQSHVPHSLHTMALTKGELMYPIWNNLLQSIKAGETGSEYLYGMDFYQYCQEKSGVPKLFDEWMTTETEIEKEAIVEAYDFSSIKTIVDVGGGEGRLLAAILQKNPNLKGILLEMPHLIKAASNLLEQSGVTERCELKDTDILKSIPTRGDILIMKHIVENWQDDLATVVLQNCYQAMNEGDILLVCESVIHSGNEPSITKLRDLAGFVITSGKERTAQEYRQLLEKTGFRMDSIIPTRGNIDIIKAIK